MFTDYRRDSFAGEKKINHEKNELCYFLLLPPGEQIRKRRCKAEFSYVPQHEDELELKIGDVIEIIAEVKLSLMILQ